jgi:hypothetical protein
MSSSLSGSPLRGPLGPLGPLGLKPIPGGVIGSNRAPGGTAPLCPLLVSHLIFQM